MEKGEREELVKNLSMGLGQCKPEIRERMIEQLRRCDKELGSRVEEGSAMAMDKMKAMSMA